MAFCYFFCQEQSYISYASKSAAALLSYKALCYPELGIVLVAEVAIARVDSKMLVEAFLLLCNSKCFGTCRLTGFGVWQLVYGYEHAWLFVFGEMCLARSAQGFNVFWRSK